MFSRPLVILLMLLITITHACRPKSYCCQSFRRRRIVAEHPTPVDDRHIVVSDPQKAHLQSYQIAINGDSERIRQRQEWPPEDPAIDLYNAFVVELFNSQSMDAINLKRDA
ncbi:unnamed protein product [Angiostrongylus costaricensis]|uniref:Uncharacterized protein n=1 Tax=Angiostrongylus costaricensis TaxID=334426 RepID=A0A0R3Q1W1_ANGCS|nr:unnamed protein product [Angiostrongylus costaricensis]